MIYQNMDVFTLMASELSMKDLVLMHVLLTSGTPCEPAPSCEGSLLTDGINMFDSLFGDGGG